MWTSAFPEAILEGLWRKRTTQLRSSVVIAPAIATSISAPHNGSSTFDAHRPTVVLAPLTVIPSAPAPVAIAPMILLISWPPALRMK